jgi:ankyrin repeat protein
VHHAAARDATAALAFLLLRREAQGAGAAGSSCSCGGQGYAAGAGAWARDALGRTPLELAREAGAVRAAGVLAAVLLGS